MTDHCGKCGSKNHLRAKFCNNCGAKLPDNRARKNGKGRMKLHADIAHPINIECRKRLQAKVISAFKKEMEKSKQSDHKLDEMDGPDDKPVEMDGPDDKPVEMEEPNDEPVEMDEPNDEPVEMDEPDDEVPEIIK